MATCIDIIKEITTENERMLWDVYQINDGFRVEAGRLMLVQAGHGNFVWSGDLVQVEQT